MFEGIEIIDSHTHFGFDPMAQVHKKVMEPDATYEGEDSIPSMFRWMKKYKVEKAVVMTGISPSVPKDWNDMEKNRFITPLLEKHPETFLGLCLINPNLGRLYGKEFIQNNLDIFFNEFGMKGVKLLPPDNWFYANDIELLAPIMEKAEEYGFPVMIHSTRVPRCMPSLIGELAENFPRNVIIIAHGGGHDHVHETIIVLKKNKNLYADSSLLWEIDIARIVNSVGAHKLLYGSDAPYLSAGVALYKIYDCNFNENDLRMILHDNAVRIFGFDE
jgi:predicted TIM-barrel fold metal-dependent hydrolase